MKLLNAILTWGTEDINCAEKFLENMGEDIYEFGEWVREYISDLDIRNIVNIDIVYLAYEYVLNRVARNIENITYTNILTALENIPYTYGNYMCTEYDNTESLIEFLEENKEQLVKHGNNTLKKFMEHLEIEI